MSIQNPILNFCVGVWVKLSNISKAVEFHLPIFLTRLDAEKIMVEKLPKKWILRGLKLRGLTCYLPLNKLAR